ncbi:hypothetical protein ElyMa_003994100 [Elysia marginata]|uniref:Uncharacterized protein n=1 Tax=Elysia marginata TaxID=1093978 RepID=A0AAV4FZQ5_9GAST|nr:hypothetical protein ElyMa_003994100 [Elysia marginata]
MNSSVYRQRRPNEHHTRPEPTATQLLRLQRCYGPVPTATLATLVLRLASSATCQPTDDPTLQMTTDEDGQLLQIRFGCTNFSVSFQLQGYIRDGAWDN